MSGVREGSGLGGGVRWRASGEDHDLPDCLAARQPIESRVEFAEAETVREQAIDGKHAGAIESEEARHIARRDRRTHIGTFDGALLAHQADGRNDQSLVGAGRPTLTVVPPRRVAA